MSLSLIPARKSVAVRVSRGQVIEVVNTHGQQVVDTWAFASDALDEHMSMEHTRAHLLRINPRPGDAFLTNRRRPILRLVDDSAGVHDMLIAACDPHRYRLLGCTEPHDNCTENLHAALAVLGLAVQGTPSPLNLFMNIPVGPDGSLSFEPPTSVPGSHVTLEAEMDAVVVFSCCPQDMVPVNGRDLRPTEAHYRVVDGAEAQPGGARPE